VAFTYKQGQAPTLTYSENPPPILYVFGPRVNIRVYSFVPGQAAFEGHALVDTGAQKTCIDVTVAQQLGYPQIDTEKLCHAHGTSEHPVFPVTFEIPGSSFGPWNNERLVGVELSAQKLCMLIGRDFLSIAHMTYNGPSGKWYMEYPAPPRNLSQMQPQDVAVKEMLKLVHRIKKVPAKTKPAIVKLTDEQAAAVAASSGGIAIATMPWQVKDIKKRFSCDDAVSALARIVKEHLNHDARAALRLKNGAIESVPWSERNVFV